MMSTRATSRLSATLVIALTIGCGEVSGEVKSNGSLSVAESLENRTVAKSLIDYSRLEAVVPGTIFTDDSGKKRPITEAVVLGTVTDVSTVAAFRSPTQEEAEKFPDGVEIAPDADDADWYQYRLGLDVESVLAGRLEVENDAVEVTVTASPTGDGAKNAVKELAALGKVAVFLYRPEVRGWEEWAIVGQGRFLAQVSEREELNFPWATPTEQSALTAQTPDLATLTKLVSR